MFWLHKHLQAKQAINSKKYAKGYERIIPEILKEDLATLINKNL